jgi:hypothetical protein
LVVLASDESNAEAATIASRESTVGTQAKAQTIPNWTDEQRSYVHRRSVPTQHDDIGVDATDEQVLSMLIAVTAAGAG